jgi:hypothetical protein
LFFGCYKTYEVYEFEPQENKYDWGILGAKLRGSEKLSGNTITISSPYELFLWFGSDSLVEGVVQIKEVKLISITDKKLLFQKISVPDKEIKQYDSTYRAYFSFKEIKLNYEDVMCYIDFVLKQSGVSKRHIFQFKFKRNYKKFKRIIGV